MHKDQAVILKELEEASKQVQVNGLYYHYKNPDLKYKAINLAITEADDEVCVIYQAQYGAKLIFVRPLASWLEKVEWENKKLDRFTLTTN